MKKRLRILVVFPTLLLIAFLFWIAFGPAPIDPVAYSPPESAGFVGTFEVNRDLSHAHVIELHNGTGPEDVAVDSLGRVYGGLHDGRIIRLLPEGKQEVFTTIEGGRPLGLHFDADENLIVADAWRGLLSIAADGKQTTLATSVDGVPFGFTDDVDIASDGKIYFSDASSKYRQPEYELDLLEGRGHGRLLVYDPSTRATRCLLDGLFFANGVALSTQEDFVLVNETGRYRITRYWLAGPKAGTAEIFIANLPGFPDGISSNDNGLFWLALPAPRSPQLDALHPSPFMKRLITMLPVPKPTAKRYGLVAALDESANVVKTLHAPDGEPVHMVTSVEQVDDSIYLGTLEAPQIGRLPVPKQLLEFEPSPP